MKLSKKLRSRIINEWVGGLPIEQKIIKLFERVRDIPYGAIGSRNPKDVYEKNMGTCSGKHILLRELYDEIGLKTKDMLCMFRFNDLITPEMNPPIEMVKILKTGPVYDFHNYIKIYVDNRWVTVDATNDLPLKRYGFIVNENWDGKSDMRLGVGDAPNFLGLTWDCNHRGVEEKIKKIAFLPKEMQEKRALLINKLSEWCAELRGRA